MSYTAPQPIGKRKVTSEKRPHAKHAGAGRANANGGWRAIPPLPRYESVHKTKYQGPTDESNWVIPGLLMAGAYPAAQEDHVHYSIIQSLLALGISTFICLQAEYEHDPNIPEFMWRQGYKLRTYIFDALRVLKAASADPSKRLGLMCNPDKLDFRHVPIVDCSTTNDDVVLELAQDICHRLKRGENIYVHCWGGHGRAGTIVSIVLGLLYELNPHEALKRCQQFHDTRRAPLGVPSPQTATQRSQVIRILRKEIEKKKRAAEKAKANAALADKKSKQERRPLVSSAVRQGVASKQGNPTHQNQNAINTANTVAKVKKPKPANAMVIETILVDDDQIVDQVQASEQQQLLPGISPINASGHGIARTSNEPTKGISTVNVNVANNVSPKAVRPLAPPKTLASQKYARNSTGADKHLGQLRRARARRPAAKKRSISRVSNSSKNSTNLKLLLGNNGNNRIKQTLTDGTVVTDISPKDANRNLLPPTGRNRGRPSTFGGRMPAAKTRRVMGTQHRKHQTGNSNSGFQRNSANNMNQLNHSKARYEKPTNRNLVLNGAHVKKTNATLQQPLKGNESNGKKQDMIRHARPSLPANGSKQNQSPRSRNLLQKKL